MATDNNMDFPSLDCRKTEGASQDPSEPTTVPMAPSQIRFLTVPVQWGSRMENWPGCFLPHLQPRAATSVMLPFDPISFLHFIELCIL